MQVKRHAIRAMLITLTGGVLLTVASSRLAAQSKQKSPTRKPPAPTPTTPPVVPTASEGSTALAMRARPASTPAGRRVNAALKTALSNANVQSAVRAEVLRQLRVRRPVALVNGYWVSAIDLVPIYEAAAVKPTLLAALGTNGPQLINQAGLGADRLMLSFIPASFGHIVIPQFTDDLTRMLGVDALRGRMTDVGPLVMIVVLAGSGFLTTVSLANTLALFLDWLFAPDPVHSGDCEDRGPTGDCDGDGVQNSEDEYPFDKDKSICDCGRPRVAMSFTTSATSDFLSSLIRVQQATQAQPARAVALGALLQGRSNSLAVVF